MWTNSLRHGSSGKNAIFLQRCLNCELKMAIFWGKCWRGNLSTHSLGNFSEAHLRWTTQAAKNVEIFLAKQQKEYPTESNNF